MSFEVARLEIELNDGPGGLGRQNGGENPIGGQAVIMRAIVEHRGGGESGRVGSSRVAVVQGCLHPVGVLVHDAGADGDDIGRVRDHGRMGNAGDKRRDVGLGNGIGPARRAVNHRTRAPVQGVGIGQICVDQFERRPRPIVWGGPFPTPMRIHGSAQIADRPVAVIGVMNLVDDISTGVRENQVSAQGRDPAGEEVSHAGILGGKRRSIGGHDQVRPRSQQCVGGKRILEALGESPAGEVGGDGVRVIQFHVALLQVSRGGKVHDFTDDDTGGAGGGGGNHREQSGEQNSGGGSHKLMKLIKGTISGY